MYAGPDQPYLFGRLRISGPDPEHRSYRSFASFSDPDGNGWLLQEVTTRLPGASPATTNYASASDLARALRRAAAAHGEHEKRTGQRDANWPDWYAEYMVRGAERQRTAAIEHIGTIIIGTGPAGPSLGSVILRGGSRPSHWSKTAENLDADRERSMFDKVQFSSASFSGYYRFGGSWLATVQWHRLRESTVRSRQSSTVLLRGSIQSR